MQVLFDWAETTVQHLHKVFPPKDSPGRYTQEGIREKKTISPSDSLHHSVGSWGMFPDSSGD